VTSCYRCNRTGKCRSCTCVKARRRCYNCLPGRMGHCVNLFENTADSPAEADPSTAAVASNPGQQIHPTSPLANLSPTLTPSTTPSSPILSAATPVPLPGHCSLPVFRKDTEPTFSWGLLSGEIFTETLVQCYRSVVHWKRNLFKVPFGRAGNFFVKEPTRLIDAYMSNSALQSVALRF